MQYANDVASAAHVQASCSTPAPIPCRSLGTSMSSLPDTLGGSLHAPASGARACLQLHEHIVLAEQVADS